MTTLVTGAGGFLGRYLVEQLVARGVRVRAFSRGRYPELDALGVESLQGDITDEGAVAAACSGCDTVFHSAGAEGIWGPWRGYFRANTLGTRHVVSACVKQGVHRLVYTSSASVTFNGTGQKGVDESVGYATKWLCHYPHTKALAERHVLESNDRGGLLTCALRPHLIWGPRDRHLIPRVIQRARHGHLYRVGDGKNRIDITYVENAAAAHLQAAAALVPGSPVCGRVYFISQGEPIGSWQWLDEILALAGLPPVQKSLSFGAAWRLGLTMELVYRLLRIRSEPPMTRFLAAQLAKDHYFDIGRARADFGYQPLISTEEGMRRLARDLQAASRG